MRLVIVMMLCGLIAVAAPSAQQKASGSLTPAIESILKSIRAADKGQLAVSEEDGRFLRTLIAARGAKSILEIGAASGYSGIWLGLGARETGGKVVAIEYDPQRAKEAAQNISRAVRFRVSRRLEARLREVLHDGVSADDAGRRVHRAQRGEQEGRHGAVSQDDPDASTAVHVDRVAERRRHVDLGETPVIE
jgi:hypothetical protein